MKCCWSRVELEYVWMIALHGFKYPPEIQSFENLTFHNVQEPRSASLLQVLITLLAFLIPMSWHRLVMTALFLWLIIPLVPTSTPCAEIDKKKCAGHRSTPIYEQSSAPPLKAPRGLQGGPLQSESIHSSLDIFKGSGHQKSESVFKEFILRLELLSANYITTHLKLLSYSFECL